MSITAANSPIQQKTIELCQTILNNPDFRAVRSRIDAFMADERAKEQYQSLVEKSEELHHKQHQGVRLSQEEISAFEKQRDVVINNPVAKGFIDAQQELQEVQETVTKYISKTMELGRVPAESDLEGGSCGSGCGCH
ncbi:MAG: YlbF family regulator [Verrucomicrobiota bacterium]|nr:YlbF family regulator [Verrucomicrobiota bacterium]